MLKMFPVNLQLNEIKSSNPLFKEGYKKIEENDFISKKRKQYFLNNYKKLWKLNHNNTNVYIFLSKNNISSYDKLLKLIFGRVNFMRLLTNNNKKLDIWIYPSNHNKIIPNTKIINVDNINSGSTTTYLNSNENGIICLWRKEEILKVLLHEIIHSFKLDRDHPYPDEAYTELKALYANIYLELLERKIPLTKKNIEKLIEKEKIFGIEQSQKINKCINNNTNIKYYINEKTRLLCNINKEEWDNYVNNTRIKKPFVNKNSLRFTITDVILKNNPKK